MSSTLRAGNHSFPIGARTLIMGIVNVTPDSFAGDGLGCDVDSAVARARRMVAEGADIIDIGGESSRPGAAPVSAEDEASRVLPVIERIIGELDVVISIDSRKAEVAAAAITAGASIVNDIWGLQGDPDMARVVAKHPDVAVIVMHNHVGTKYENLMSEILEFLSGSIEIAEAAGIGRDRVVVDPGFGFGKTPAQNIEIIQRLGEFRASGCPLLVGTSNKSTLGLIFGGAPVSDRAEASVALVALSIARGADIVRVHDVKATARVARITDQVVRSITDDVRALSSPGRTL